MPWFGFSRITRAPPRVKLAPIEFLAASVCSLSSMRSSTPVLLCALIAVVSGCAQLQPSRSSASPETATSLSLPNDPIRAPWQAVPIRFKSPTLYSRAEIEGVPCILAEANASWSLQAAKVPNEFANASTLSWRWHVSRLLLGSDSETRGSDDSPARVIISFKGDKTKIDAPDRSAMNMAKMIGGWEIPYATIQYIWENDTKTETLIPHHTISRIQKIVVRSGEPGLASWLSFERNVREDYRRAFGGEEPGEIESVGVMTDTDSLGGTARTCYADLALRR
jgi:Protein of unknown function (DUF3047)